MNTSFRILLPVLIFALPFVGRLPAQPPTDPIAAAKAAWQKGDLAAVENAVAPLAAATPPSAPAAYYLGLVRQKQGRLPEAVKLLDQAAALEPTQPDYHVAVGMAAAEQMRGANFMQLAQLSNKMRKAYAKAVELDPKHIGGLIGLARYYSSAPEMAGGSREKAREYAQRIRELVPYLGEQELGQIAERAEDLAGALQHYEAASTLKPDHAGSHAAAARVLAKLGRNDEARARYEKVLAIAPHHEAARAALAKLPPS
jgi:tetratricopeptide (TPR) repeat protein